MSGWGERYCNNVNYVKNNVIFEPPSMRACSSTPPKQNQDFVKEQTPLMMYYNGFIGGECLESDPCMFDFALKCIMLCFCKSYNSTCFCYKWSFRIFLFFLGGSPGCKRYCFKFRLKRAEIC